MDWLKAKPKTNWTRRDVALLAAGVAAAALALILLIPAKAGKGKVQAPAPPAAAHDAAKADAAELLRRAEEKYAEGRKIYESGLPFSARRLCEEAVQLYQQYLKLIPGDLRAMTAMAGAALYAGQVDVAREAYRQALEEGRKWLAGAHVGYAVLLADYDRDYNAAREHLGEAVRLDSEGDAGRKAKEMLGKIGK